MDDTNRLLNIQPEKNKVFRSIDLKPLAKIDKLSLSISNQYRPILLALRDLIECFQNDTANDNEKRTLNLANLILIRHIALLKSLTKDINTKDSINKFIKETILDNISEEANSKEKDDYQQLYNEINDAIVIALKSWKSGSSVENNISTTKKTETSSITSKDEVDISINIPLNEKILEEKSNKLIKTKQYQDFLKELKKDFDQFLDKYDNQNQNKKNIQNIVTKSSQINNQKNTLIKKKSNNLIKIPNVLKIGQKLNNKKKSNEKNNFLFKKIQVASIKKFVKSRENVIKNIGKKIFNKNIYKSVFNKIKSGIILGGSYAAKSMSTYLNLFGRGPIFMIFNLLLLPIKLLAGALLFVIKPLINLIKGVANLILKPLKFLIGSPLKALKGFITGISKLVSGLLKFVQAKTILNFLKRMLKTPSGMFMLGYITGFIYINFKKIVNMVSSITDMVKEKITNKLNSLKSVIDNIKIKYNAFTENNKIARKIKEIVSQVNDIFGDDLARIKDWIMQWAWSAKLVANIIAAVWKTKLIQYLIELKKLTNGPLGYLAEGLSGMEKAVAIGVSAFIEGLKTAFEVSKDSKSKVIDIKLRDAFKSQYIAHSEEKLKELNFNEEKKEKYFKLIDKLNLEKSTVNKLFKELDLIENIITELDGKAYSRHKFNIYRDLPGLVDEILKPKLFDGETLYTDEFHNLMNDYGRISTGNGYGAVQQLKLLKNILNFRMSRSQNMYLMMKSNDVDLISEGMELAGNFDASKNKMLIDQNTGVVSWNHQKYIEGKLKEDGKKQARTELSSESTQILQSHLIITGMPQLGLLGKNIESINLNELIGALRDRKKTGHNTKWKFQDFTPDAEGKITIFINPNMSNQGMEAVLLDAAVRMRYAKRVWAVSKKEVQVEDGKLTRKGAANRTDQWCWEIKIGADEAIILKQAMADEISRRFDTDRIPSLLERYSEEIKSGILPRSQAIEILKQLNKDTEIEIKSEEEQIARVAERLKTVIEENKKKYEELENQQRVLEQQKQQYMSYVVDAVKKKQATNWQFVQSMKSYDQTKFKYFVDPNNEMSNEQFMLHINSLSYTEFSSLLEGYYRPN